MAMLNTLLETGDSANRIDIVFLGEGYTASEIDTAYASDVAGLVAALFDGSALTQPFGRYENFFNVHRIDLASPESGATDQSLALYPDTALDARYYWDGVTERLLYIDEAAADAALDAALAGTGIEAELRFVPVNATRYGGGGGAYSVYAAGNEWAHELALHELGHAFLGFADEYGGYRAPYPFGEPSEPNVTLDPGAAKWAEWIGYDQPGIGPIGAYQGAYYYDQGIFRPSLASKMRVLGAPFDAVAREAFVHAFYALVDPIDAHTPNAATVVNRHSLTTQVIDPAVIQVDWTVDGTLFPDAGEVFSLEDHGFGFGTYRVTARAYDPTDWVRGDRSDLEQSVSWTVANDFALTGSEDGEALTGTARANAIRGLGGADTIDGRGGADTLIGGPGDDLYRVDHPGDVVIELPGEGRDTVQSRVSWTLGAEVEALQLLGTAAIEGTGNGLANALTGNGAANRLNGAAGADTLRGGAGDDLLRGGLGPDLLLGGPGDDTLVGGEGCDRLLGGAGRDVLRGGGGADIFILAAEAEAGPAPRDLIRDFAPGSDRIDLRRIDADTTLDGHQGFAPAIRDAPAAAPGTLWLAGGVLYGNTDADADPEFELRIVLDGPGGLTAADLLL